MHVCAFIQARMSSNRFPGKMLAPFRGRPLVDHVVEAVRRGVPDSKVVLVTSRELSDDPLVAHAEKRGYEVFRGPLDDVLGRFRAALDARDPTAEWALRICGDSPILSASVIRRVVAAARPDLDLVTTIEERTFPHGQNAELISAAVLRALDDDKNLSAHHREHVTQGIHQNRAKYKVLNVTSGDPTLATRRHAVDTVDDLLRLEKADLAAELAGVEE